MTLLYEGWNINTNLTSTRKSLPVGTAAAVVSATTKTPFGFGGGGTRRRRRTMIAWRGLLTIQALNIRQMASFVC